MAESVFLGSVYAEAELRTDKFDKGVADVNNQLNSLEGNTNARTAAMGKSFERAGGGVQAFASQLRGAGTALVAIGAAPTAALAGATKIAIDFESAFAGIRKTVEASEAEFAQLSTNIRNISKTTPVAATELSRIGELAGQLGVSGVNELSKFIETISQIAVTTNLTTEAAATDFARIANIMQEPLTNVDRMGASVVGLGNNFATTEAEISEFAQRIAGAGRIAGLTTADVFAIGASLSSVGVQAEAGGTAVQKFLIEMNTAVAQGGDKLATFASAAGLTMDQFKNLSPIERFQAVVEGLAIAGDDAVLVLEELGLQDQRMIRSFLSLANAGDLLERAVRESSTAWEENTALTDEAAKRYATTESQIQIFKNNLADLGITLGSVLLPRINEMIKAITPMINRFAKFAEAHPKLITGLLAIGAALGIIGAVLVTVGAIIGPIVAAWGLLTTIGGALATALGAVAAAIGAVSLPVLAIIAVVIALIAALYLLWKNWDQVSEFLSTKWAEVTTFIGQKLQELTEWLRNLGTQIGTGLATAFQALKNSIVTAFAGIVSFVTVTIPQIIQTIISFFLQLPARMLEVWAQMLLSFVYGLGLIVGFIVVGVPLLVETIINFLASLPERVGAILTSVYNWFTTTWNNILTASIAWVTNTYNQITNWLSQLPGKVQEILTQVYNWFVEKWSDIKKWLTTEVPRMVADVVKWLSELPPKLWAILVDAKNQTVTGFKNIWSAIISEISSWPSRLFDWGKRLIQSLSDGIRSALDSIVDAFKAGFNKAREIVEGHSPPRRGPLQNIDKWGYNIGASWVEGFQLALNGLDVPLPELATVGVSQPSPAPINNTRNFQPNLTVNIGMYAGTPMEKREIARQLNESLDEYKRSTGESL